jgi:2-polyprenyl-3-methyl-5-hydroxy-6-metoxy-1,4-benzoquinol methylase
VVREGVRRVIPFIRAQRVVEAGCGDGFVTSLIAEHAQSVFAFDISPRAIAFAKLIVERPNVTFRVGKGADMRALVAEAGPVDAVVAFEVLEHLVESERDAFLAQARELLHPQQGWLLLTTPNGRRPFGHVGHRHAREFSEGDLRRTLGAAGFAKIDIQGLYLKPFPDKLEHFAPVVPFRAAFRALAKAGSKHPRLCRTLIASATPAESPKPRLD